MQRTPVLYGLGSKECLVGREDREGEGEVEVGRGLSCLLFSLLITPFRGPQGSSALPILGTFTKHQVLRLTLVIFLLCTWYLLLSIETASSVMRSSRPRLPDRQRVYSVYGVLHAPYGALRSAQVHNMRRVAVGPSEHFRHPCSRASTL